MRQSDWTIANIGRTAFCAALITAWGALADESTAVEKPNQSRVVKLAVVGPLTPSSKAFGIPHLQGITLAVDEYNQQHSASGPEVQLEIFDDKATPATGASIVGSLANSDAMAVLGPANSAVTSAVIDLLQTQPARIPVISSLATATNLTENLKTQYFLRANVSDETRLATLRRDRQRAAAMDRAPAAPQSVTCR